MAVLIVIGKILLTILLILICLLVILLFDPIRYEADVEIDSKSAAVRVQWLFGLIRFRFHYRDGPQAEIRLLWKRIDLLNPKPKQEKKKQGFLLGRNHSGKKDKTAAVAKTESTGIGEQVPGASAAETEAEIFPENAGAADQTGKKAADTEAGSKNGAASDTARSSPKRKFPFTNRNHKRAGTGVSGTAGKVKSVVGKWRTILGMVSEYHVLDSVWPRLKRLLSHILPRRISGNISFGFSDPGTTGAITGIIAMIPLLYETELEIHPDFETEENTIHGHFEAAGRIQLIWVVILIVGLLLDKQFRQFIGQFRKEWQSLSF